IGTVFVSLIQSLAVVAYAYSIPNAVLIQNIWLFRAIAMVSITTGTMATIWLGEQITSRGIGNGVSMLIFAGIVSRLPSAVWELGGLVKNNEINVVFVVVVLLMFVAVVALVVYEQQGQRKIPVHYAKRVVGRKMYGGQNTYIPFKLNPSGVIPVIFASSFLTFPLQLATSFGVKYRWLARVANFLTPSGWWYNIIQVLLIVFFAYFYTQVTLNPTEIAKNIRENGGSIPGIRTDKMEEYMQKVLNRLMLPGSLYLAFIAVIPTIIQNLFGFPHSISSIIGGTSLLILVGVDLDTMSQVEALLKMHHHDGLVKKGKLRSRNL
ncbi:MAG TPA: preprotein translocase subunit SecY, partial [Treponemataceae bacterium]|nr:preprotein translocase subunit SecY [Treponemataceae bacterium]